jgi:hypothetical protein
VAEKTPDHLTTDAPDENPGPAAESKKSVNETDKSDWLSDLNKWAENRSSESIVPEASNDKPDTQSLPKAASAESQ